MSKMRIALCYDPPKVDHEQKVAELFDSLEFLRKNLLELGHMVIEVPYKKNVYITSENIMKYNPALLWNLFSVNNVGRTQNYFKALLLDDLGIPYTGSSVQTILFCADNILVKDILRSAGANVPIAYALGEPFVPGKWILKSKSELSSSKKSIIYVKTEQELREAILSYSIEENIFAEEYVEGEEYYFFLIDKGIGLKTFAIAKKILTESSESLTFEFDVNRIKSLDKMFASVELICNIIKLESYAVISIKWSQNTDKLWVTDVISNPDISENSDFTGACIHSKLGVKEMLSYIINSAISKHKNINYV